MVSDDVGTAEAVAQVPVPEQAVRSAAAGVDVVLTVAPGDAAPMGAGAGRAATADPAFAARVRESAGRVLALKERFGLLRC